MSDKKVIKCLNCNHSMRIPTGKHIKFNCPSCKKEFIIDDRLQNKKDNNINDTLNKNIGKSFVSSTSSNIENTQWTKYKTDAGHGFSAEDVNALNDILRGYDVEKAGLSNEKNGADRVVNGQAIQTKYYKSAYKTVESAFDSNGFYKYKNQKLEVPSDQYDEAVKRFSEKIKQGKIEGINDPNQAKSLVKKGDVTYKQAKNIAKAGNIDSLKFDVKNQIISTSYAFGISFAINYYTLRYNGYSKKEAVTQSVKSSLKSSGLVMTSGVLTQQFLRTTLGRNLASVSTVFSKQIVNSVYKTQLGKQAIHKVASSQVGKQVSGASAKNVATKTLRTNAITGIVTTVVLTAPDFYRAVFTKTISWKQFSKNFAVNSAGVIAGIGGGIAGGSWGGPWGAFAGGVFGGVGAAYGAKKLADLVSVDDSKEIYDMITDEISSLASEYLLSKKEFESIDFNKIFKEKITSKWLRKLYRYGKTESKEKQQKEIRAVFEPSIKEKVKNRKQMSLPNINEVITEIVN